MPDTRRRRTDISPPAAELLVEASSGPRAQAQVLTGQRYFAHGVGEPGAMRELGEAIARRQQDRDSFVAVGR